MYPRNDRTRKGRRVRLINPLLSIPTPKDYHAKGEVGVIEYEYPFAPERGITSVMVCFDGRYLTHVLSNNLEEVQENTVLDADNDYWWQFDTNEYPFDFQYQQSETLLITTVLTEISKLSERLTSRDYWRMLRELDNVLGKYLALAEA